MDSRRAARLMRLAATAVVLTALFIPVLRDHDSFPLSTHPVYSSARDRDATLVTAVGVTASGEESRLSMQLIAGSDDPLITQSVLTRAVASSTETDLCEEIARRVVRSSDHRTIVEIAIVSDSMDLVDFVVTGEIEERQTRSTCAVRR